MLGMFAASASAAPSAQLPQYATPTPGPDGKIIYEVAAGDSCIRIQLLTGIPVQQLKALNNLDDDCTIVPGQKLLIGIGASAAASPTPNPLVSPTPVIPTPTPLPGKASVCVLLFEDKNGNALRQDGEDVIASGAVSITAASGDYSVSRNTEGGTEPICFNDEVPEGIYTISAAAPSDYFATTEQSIILEVKAGAQVHVRFGAQKADPQSAPAANTDKKSQSSPILGIVGGFLVLASIGLGVYYWMAYGRRPTYKSPPSPPGIAQ